MSFASLLFTLGCVHFAALVAPGPDFALMLRASTLGGRRHAFLLALGLSTAIMMHTAIVTFAASALQQVLPGIMRVLPWLAAGWLGWLGWSCLRAAWQFQPAQGEATATSDNARQLGNGWWTGFATNVLNPKAYVYFFSVIAGMLPAVSPLQFKLSLVALFFVLALGWFGFLGWALNIPRLRNWLMSHERGTLYFTGAILTVFALLLVAQGVARLSL